MSEKAARDPTLLLVICAGVAAAAGWRALRSLEVGGIVAAVSSHRYLVLLVAGAAAGVGLRRAVATRRSLESRVSLLVVPADEFDPSAETVVRFAAQLVRVRRSVRGWLDRRASAVRVQLENDPEGRLLYLLEVPGHAVALVRGALRGYEGIELRERSERRGASRASRAKVARAELVLARPSVEPLVRLELDPDPLAAFASALRALSAADGDRAVVCVDLLPATAWERTRWRRRLLAQARRRGKRTGSYPEALRGERLRPGPAELSERRAESRALDAKLKDSGALFSLQLLVRVQTADPAGATIALRSLLGCFEQFADRNWLRVAGVPLAGLTFLGSDLPGRGRWFDHRLRSGLHRPTRRGVVSAGEIAAFLKPPTARCGAENVLRCGALVAPAPALPRFERQPELIPLGRVASEAGERTVGVRVADTFFSYCAGRSRYGKTELAIAQFLHLVQSGHGGLFLDPHEDALVRIKPHLTDETLRERVVEINLAGPRAAARQPAWNLFELSASEPAEAERRVEAVVDAFASALRWDERNTRALNLTTQAAAALAAVARSLPAELCPTIFQLPTLLSDEDWRRACLPFLPKASQRFWLDRFPRLSEEAITPVTNLIDRLRASGPTTALLGQSQSSYRIREAMDGGQIVLACPGSGGTRDRLVANLLVFDLLHAAKGRAELAPQDRRPFWVFLDEVQTYDGASSGNLAALLEQTAKYGVRAFLLNQNPERLTSATLNAVTTNRSHLLTTTLNHKGAQLIAKEWAGRLDPAAITKLRRYRFLCQVTHAGEQTKPFQLTGLPVEELVGEGDPDGLKVLESTIDQTAARRPVAAALEELDTLDERIRAALRRRHRHHSDDEPARAQQASAQSAPRAHSGRRRIGTPKDGG